MNREQVIQRLHAMLPELQADYGVASLGLFGSVARGEQTVTSDFDFFVRFSPEAGSTLTPLIRLLSRFEAEFGERVDIVEDHPRLDEAFRSTVTRDLIRVA